MAILLKHVIPSMCCKIFSNSLVISSVISPISGFLSASTSAVWKLHSGENRRAKPHPKVHVTTAKGLVVDTSWWWATLCCTLLLFRRPCIASAATHNCLVQNSSALIKGFFCLLRLQCFIYFTIINSVLLRVLSRPRCLQWCWWQHCESKQFFAFAVELYRVGHHTQKLSSRMARTRISTNTPVRQRVQALGKVKRTVLTLFEITHPTHRTACLKLSLAASEKPSWV